MFLIALSSNPTSSLAQYEWQEGADSAKQSLGDGLEYRLETSGSFSNEKTPLWLNANKYGLSSLEKQNGYLRGCLLRPLATDNAHHWGIGYGVDVVVPYHSRVSWWCNRLLLR